MNTGTIRRATALALSSAAVAFGAFTASAPANATTVVSDSHQAAAAQSPHRTSPSADTFSSGRIKAAGYYFRLRNLKSGKYLQPSGGSRTAWVPLVQEPLGDDTQVWSTYYDGNLIFINKADGLNMGIDHASIYPGANAIQAPADGSNNQHWWKVRRDSQTFELHNYKSGLCLGISGGSTANGANAAQFRCDGSTNQGWQAI